MIRSASSCCAFPNVCPDWASFHFSTVERDNGTEDYLLHEHLWVPRLIGHLNHRQNSYLVSSKQVIFNIDVYVMSPRVDIILNASFGSLQNPKHTVCHQSWQILCCFGGNGCTSQRKSFSFALSGMRANGLVHARQSTRFCHFHRMNTVTGNSLKSHLYSWQLNSKTTSPVWEDVATTITSVTCVQGKEL